MKFTTVALHALNALAIFAFANTAQALLSPPTYALVAAYEPAQPPMPELYPDAPAFAAKRPLPRPESVCRALNAYFEARGEGERGIAAVTQVVLNRTAQGYLGAKNDCQTVFARKQFSWTHENPVMPTGEELKRTREITEAVARGRYLNRVGKSHLYYNPNKVDAWWAPHYAEVAVIGNHRFMK